MLNEPRQLQMKKIGDQGCYLLTIVHIAEQVLQERLDAVKIYEDVLAAGLITDDCYVKDSAGLLNSLVPVRYTCIKFDTLDQLPQDGDWEVLRYERPTPGVLYSHFVLGDGHGKVAWDPLGVSNTVAYGHLAARRVFRRV